MIQTFVFFCFISYFSIALADFSFAVNKSFDVSLTEVFLLDFVNKSTWLVVRVGFDQRS